MDRFKLVCKCCNYEWFSKIIPKRCANCKTWRWNKAGSKLPPRVRAGRPSDFPVYRLRVGESCFIPFLNLPCGGVDVVGNTKTVDKITRHAKRTGKVFRREAGGGGLKVTRLNDKGSESPI